MRVAVIRCALLIAVAVALAHFAQASFWDPEDDRVIFRGALAPGTTTVQLVGNDYVLLFVGDETVEYHVNRASSDFTNGILTITEAASGATLMRGGQSFQYGPYYGQIIYPIDVPTYVTVTKLADSIVANKVVIDYQHVYSAVTNRIRYEISIEGKSLTVRSYSLTPSVPNFGPNYHGFYVGQQGNMPSSRFLRIPYMEPVPVIMFSNNWFYGQTIDYTQSRGGSRYFYSTGEGQTTPKYFVYPQYEKMTDASINHWVDDTCRLIISSKIEDVFVDTDNYPASPHRICANKTAVIRYGGDAPGGFADVKAAMEKKYRAGFFNFQSYLWNWAYYYINVNEPTSYPPNPDRGSPADYNLMMNYVRNTNNRCGLYYTIELMDQGYVSSCPIFHG